MSTTRKILTVVFVMFSTVATSFAQKHHRGQGTIEDQVNKRLDKIDAVVKFTGNQRNDLKILFTNLATKKKDAFCSNEMESNGMEKAMKSIRKEQKDGLKKILTNDQMKLLKAYKKEHKSMGHKKGKGKFSNNIDKQLDKMDEVVKFTGNQRSDLKIFLAEIAKRKKDAVCSNDPGSDGLKDALKVIHTDKKEGIKKILTGDQYKLLEDHMKTKHDKHKKHNHGKNDTEK